MRDWHQPNVTPNSIFETTAGVGRITQPYRAVVLRADCMGKWQLDYRTVSRSLTLVVPQLLSPQPLYGCSRLPGYTHVGHRPALFPWPDNQTFEVGTI